MGKPKEKKHGGGYSPLKSMDETAAAFMRQLIKSGKKLAKNSPDSHSNQNKRSLRDSDVDLLTDNHTSPTPLKSKVKRPRISETQSVESVETPTAVVPEVSPIALLGAIRKRLDEVNKRTLYVRKLPRKITIGYLKSVCRTSVSARLQRLTGRKNRRHAFVEFKSAEQAVEACAALNGKLIADRPISAQLCSERTVNKETNEKSGSSSAWKSPQERLLSEFQLNTIYVSCIPYQTSEDEIRELFPAARTFEFSTIPGGCTIVKCRVSFENEADALHAFTTQHGTVINGSPLNVNFAFKKFSRVNRRQTVLEMSSDSNVSNMHIKEKTNIITGSSKKKEHSKEMKISKSKESSTLPVSKQKKMKKINKNKKAKTTHSEDKQLDEHSTKMKLLDKPICVGKLSNKLVKKNKNKLGGSVPQKSPELPSKPQVKKRRLV